ncbi:MAG: glutamate-1-semialdehyde 2,1-aminomutase [Deltaproteobacteria bacterium]|nr:glutamate-1-semialdehyde 2,1-aminomutase [Deltaproteobacteria bacterium]
MAKNHHNSHELFQKAIKLIPGGVNSPVRACKSVGTIPAFIHHADGCMIVDMDGNAYIDYVGSWGPMILGHRHPAVMEAIRRVLERGTSFGAPTDLETELAQLVVDAVPSIEMVRMVNSGTEATMSAIRLARGVTGRDLIIKFDGCYHGHADALLVSAGSGVATLAISGSPGIPDAVASQTLSLIYNDSDGFVKIMDRMGEKVAAVIVEPVAGNMGMVPPVAGFLETLRSETTRCGSLLIFDEVMTGFRVAHGGAQVLYNISPDLTTLGKIIGGGLPVGAYGGKRDIMAQIAPQGPVYQAGTLSGNPLAMAAGIATLEQIKQPGFYEALNAVSEMLIDGLEAAIRRTGIKARAGRVGSMAGLFFTDKTVRNFDDAKTADLTLFSAYYRGMLEQGIYLAPSQFEALFISAAHGKTHIAETVRAAEAVFQGLAA